MKNILFIFLLVSCFFTTQAQNKDFDKLVNEGIEQHDNGNYDKAIELYLKALKIDSKSSLANYEIALTYYTKKDYKNAVKYCDKVIELKDNNIKMAYNIKGNALDMMGKTQEAVDVLEKAIKDFGGDYLMHYNLAINYFKLNDIKNVEKNLATAIEIKPTHTSSHYMLGMLQADKGKIVEAALPLYFFLLLEPDSERSKNAYRILQSTLRKGVNVKKQEGKPDEITLNISSADGEFTVAEMSIGLAVIANHELEDKTKSKLSDDEKFVKITEMFFKVLEEQKDKGDNIWWNVYINPMFAKLAKTPHLEAFCYYISQSNGENTIEWLNNNEEALKGFSDWVKNL